MDFIKKESKLGEYGTATVTISDKGLLSVMVQGQVDLIAELEKLAAETATKVDDQAISWIKTMLGVKQSQANNPAQV